MKQRLYFLGGDSGELLTGAASGSLGGAALGPVGAIAGGAIGLATGLINQKKEKEAEEAANEAMRKSNLLSSRQQINSLNTGLNLVAMGGNINSKGNDFIEFNNGGSHETNPLNGIPISFGQNGQANLVEEGETKKGDFIFSDRLILEDPLSFGLSNKYSGKTFSNISKDLHKSLDERPNDPISKNTFNLMTDRLKEANNTAKSKSELQESINYKCGGKLLANGGKIQEGDYDLGDVDLDMEEIQYLKELGYNVEVESPVTEEFKDGGSININPAKKGTFKAQATKMGMGVQEAASHILNSPKGTYSPEMRRKANFAKNFAK